MQPPYAIKNIEPSVTGNPNATPVLQDWYRDLSFAQRERPADGWMLPFYPTAIHLDAEYGDMPDVIGGGDFPCYSEKLRKIIEEFEPNCHQFLPVEIYSMDGKLLDKYFVFKCGNSLHDTVCLEKSAVERVERGEMIFWRKIPLKPLVIKRRAVEGKHYWFDDVMLLNFVSNEMHDAVQRERITGFKFEKQEII